MNEWGNVGMDGFIWDISPDKTFLKKRSKIKVTLSES